MVQASNNNSCDPGRTGAHPVTERLPSNNTSCLHQLLIITLVRVFLANRPRASDWKARQFDRHSFAGVRDSVPPEVRINIPSPQKVPAVRHILVCIPSDTLFRSRNRVSDRLIRGTKSFHGGVICLFHAPLTVRLASRTRSRVHCRASTSLAFYTTSPIRDSILKR